MNFKHILIGALLCLPFVNNAQDLRCPPVDATGHGTQKIDVTLGAGPTLLYGDINHRSNLGFGIALKGDYKIYKGFYAGLEVQGGQLKPAAERLDSTGLVSSTGPNRYWAGSINATVYPYRFFVNERDLFRKSKFEQLVLNGFYVGAGFGGVRNNYPLNDDDHPSSSLHFPVNVGVAVPLNKYYSHGPGYFSAVVNTQFNFSTNDYLDGHESGESKDMYNFTYVGIRYSF